MKFRVIISSTILSALAVGCGTHRGQEKGHNVLSGGGAIDAGSDTECGKILDGDLFNEITSSGTSVERDLAQVRFFTLSEQEAWTVYQQAQSNQTNGGGALGVNVIGLVDIGGSGSGGHVQNFNEFKQAFARAKQQFNQYVSTDHYKNASDTYSSVVRDAASVQAWSDCIQQTSGAPKFRMVLRREGAEQVFAQVYYSAGAFAGSLPKLRLDFTGGQVEGEESHGSEIGQGSKVFTIDVAKDVEDIGVNGTTPDGKTNFSFIDKLPPTKDEFEASRCHVQNVLMLMSGQITLPIFSALEAGSGAAFPSARGAGSESCQSWLAGV